VLFLAWGLFLMGITYLDKITSAIWGKPELWTTNLGDLPPISLNRISQKKQLEKYLSIFLLFFPTFLLFITIFAFFRIAIIYKILISLILSVIFLWIMESIRRRAAK
jgi:hypothetical protein